MQQDLRAAQSSLKRRQRQAEQGQGKDKGKTKEGEGEGAEMATKKDTHIERKERTNQSPATSPL